MARHNGNGNTTRNSFNPFESMDTRGPPANLNISPPADGKTNLEVVNHIHTNASTMSVLAFMSLAVMIEEKRWKSKVNLREMVKSFITTKELPSKA